MLRDRRLLQTAAIVLFAVAALAVVGVWDQKREAAVAMSEFTDEQVRLARNAAADVAARVASVHRDADSIAALDAKGADVPTSLRAPYVDVRVTTNVGSSDRAHTRATDDDLVLAVPESEGRVVELTMRHDELVAAPREVPGPASVLLLRAPGEAKFHARDGRVVDSPALMHALQRHETSFIVDHPNAVALGLPERTSFAGVASFTEPALGTFDVVVATSAASLRDRETRAGNRLALVVVATGGLGLLALLRQRREALLSRALAVEEARREGDARLERTSRAATLGTLALGIAHEVSTPLGVISARAEQLVENGNDPARVEAGARSILEQADRIHGVVRGFLGLARGDSPSSETLLPGDIARGAADLVAHRFAQKRVTLTREVADELPPVAGDRRLLEHAIVNLLLNACDASPQGAVVTLRVSSDGAGVVFLVLDEGEGISRENANHVLEPFFTTKREGSGLGLAIAHEIVKSFRGQLTIGPRASRGTECRITLPARP